MASGKRNPGQRGVSLLLGTASLIFIVPIVGLVIDVGILYSAKSRLQAAVDGASLAAARALNLGQSTNAQATQAKQNAVNWFYANFPAGNWSTNNTLMDTSDTHVLVQNDPSNTNQRDVNVTATTTVPTWFMRWFNVNSTTVSAQGFASRRDVVMMMIMDRSGSMNSNNGCANMRSAAKVFTGQFAAQRDRIGMVEFGDTSWVDTDPTINFQTVLGYSNSSGSANGFIDTISCGDNTGTAQALALGYNELYKTNLPGAFNILLFFTDGIPNSLTLNFTKGGNSSSLMLPGPTGAYAGNCKDSTGTAIRSGGSFVTHPPNWTTGWTMALGSYFASIPSGPIGVIASDDPTSSGSYGVRFYQGTSQAQTNHGTIGSGTAAGCEFTNGSSVAPGKGGEENYVDDFQLLPPTDAWGSALNDVTYNNLPRSDWRLGRER